LLFFFDFHSKNEFWQLVSSVQLAVRLPCEWTGQVLGANLMNNGQPSFVANILKATDAATFLEVSKMDLINYLDGRAGDL